MNGIIAENLKESILPEKKFREHKIMTQDIIAKLSKNGFNNDAGKVNRCGSWLLFSHQQHIITTEQRLRLKKANFCKYRFCPMCQWRRSYNLCKELKVACEKIEKKYKVAYIFMTLTVKNSSVTELKESVQELNKAFERMTKTQVFQGAILGHFKAIEILGDKTADGEVHPHLHVLCIVSRKYFSGRYYISQKKWTAMWQKALRVDYTPQIDVRRVYPDKKKRFTALQCAIFEVAKYSVKSTDLVHRSDEDFREIIKQTHRMRFYATGGILKLNLQRIDQELIRLDEKDKEFWAEIEELLYSWKDNDYFLTKKGVKV